MDIRQRRSLYLDIHEEKERERLRLIMDIADAVRMGNMGIQSKKADGLYQKWHMRLERKITGVENRRQSNIWDQAKTGSKKLN
jgi:hypothetical protein